MSVTRLLLGVSIYATATIAPFSGAIAANGAIPSSTSMQLGGEAPMPAGYLSFCQATPRLCNLGGRSRRGAVRLTPDRFQQLQAVTQGVNRSMRAVEDRVRFGVADRWTVGGGQGDCEDFAMTKRAMLIARGWSPSSVLVALVYFRGAQHAVLVARTDGGDYVLDNLNSAVKPWRGTPYSWAKIQDPSEFTWRSL